MRWCRSTKRQGKAVKQERREEQARAGGHRLGWAREANEDTVRRRARVGRRRVERGVWGVQRGTERNSNARGHGREKGGRVHWRGREREQRKGCS